MSEAARARREAGHDVISLGIGEPDFDTPEHVRAAAIAAINAGDTKYPPIAGKPALRAAIPAAMKVQKPPMSLSRAGRNTRCSMPFLPA